MLSRVHSNKASFVQLVKDLLLDQLNVQSVTILLLITLTANLLALTSFKVVRRQGQNCEKPMINALSNELGFLNKKSYFGND